MDLLADDDLANDDAAFDDDAALALMVQHHLTVLCMWRRRRGRKGQSAGGALYKVGGQISNVTLTQPCGECKRTTPAWTTCRRSTTS